MKKPVRAKPSPAFLFPSGCYCGGKRLRGSLGARRRSVAAGTAGAAAGVSVTAAVTTAGWLDAAADSNADSSAAACTASATEAASDDGRAGAMKLSSIPTSTDAGITNSAGCAGAWLSTGSLVATDAVPGSTSTVSAALATGTSTTAAAGASAWSAAAVVSIPTVSGTALPAASTTGWNTVSLTGRLSGGAMSAACVLAPVSAGAA